MAVAEKPIEDGRGPLKEQGLVAVQDVIQGAIRSQTCGVDVTFQHVALHSATWEIAVYPRSEFAFGPGDRLR